MPYYPPHPEPEPNGPEKKRGKKQEKEPFRSHALRTGAVCLLASLALYGGIRLISYITDRKGHDIRYAVDPTKIRNELGWQAETKFMDGIKKTIKWYLEHRDWWEEIIRS